MLIVGGALNLLTLPFSTDAKHSLPTVEPPERTPDRGSVSTYSPQIL